MNDLSGYTEEQLYESIRLLRDDPQWAHLASQCKMEIISRKMPPIEEIFPNGGYVKENPNGKLEVVPFKTL